MKSLTVLGIAACASSGSPPTKPPEHKPADPHEHHQMHHRFDKAEDWVPVFDDPKRDEWQKPDAVVAALALAPGMTVADLGAGTGYFAKRLSAAVGANGKVVALDTEPDMIFHMKKRAEREGTPNVEPRQIPFDDPKLAPASVDRILIVNTWHHIEHRGGYAKKLAAALKPGGFVLVVDFTLEAEKGPPKQHRLAPQQVSDELSGAGLKASTIAAGLPDQYVVKAEMR